MESVTVSRQRAALFASALSAVPSLVGNRSGIGLSWDSTDYIAVGKVIPERIAEIVSGIARGCIKANTSLIGGETAEHPGLLKEDEFDIAGAATGDEQLFQRSVHPAGWRYPHGAALTPFSPLPQAGRA